MENKIEPRKGHKSYYQKTAEKINLVKIAITNTLSNHEIGEALAKRGYSKEELTQVQTLVTQAESLQSAQVAMYGDKYKSTDDFMDARAKVEEFYRDHTALAKVALGKNRGALEKLQLNGKRKDSISGWISQAKSFYTNAIESDEIKAALAKKGITADELIESKKKVDQLDSKEAEKYDKKGNAENATISRNNAIDELIEWHSGFKKTARIALRSKPQLLETLAISVKSK